MQSLVSLAKYFYKYLIFPRKTSQTALLTHFQIKKKTQYERGSFTCQSHRNITGSQKLSSQENNLNKTPFPLPLNSPWILKPNRTDFCHSWTWISYQCEPQGFALPKSLAFSPCAQDSVPRVLSGRESSWEATSLCRVLLKASAPLNCTMGGFKAY